MSRQIRHLGTPTDRPLSDNPAVLASFNHPLLRLAAGDEILARMFRTVPKTLRDLMRPERLARLTPEERAQACKDVIAEAERMWFRSAGVDVLRRELTSYIAARHPSVGMLNIQFEGYLYEEGLSVGPLVWVSGDAGDAGGGPVVPPKLQSREAWLLPDPVRAKLPPECSLIAQRSVAIALEAIADGTISGWSVTDGENLIRQIVLMCLYGTTHPDFPRRATTNLDWFEGVGLGLWQTLAERIPREPKALGAQPAATQQAGQASRTSQTSQTSQGKETVPTGPTAPTPQIGDRPLWTPATMTLILMELRGRAGTKSLSGTSAGSETRSAGDVAKPPANVEGAQDKTSASPEAAAAPPGWLVVIQGPIPPASDRNDREALGRFETLCQPVPVAATPSAEAARGVLDTLTREFPWATHVLSALEQMLSAATLWGVRELRLEPALLVGPPGTGKSRIVRRLAELLQLPYMPLALGGAHDAKLLCGTARGWSSADASPIVRLLAERQSASALVLLDELDKVYSYGEGSTDHSAAHSPIHSQLLGLLEPETASRWRDGYLLTTCDLSRVSYWATANSLKPINRALLSRMEVLYFPAPGPEHLPAIVASMVREQERQWSLPEGTLPAVPESAFNRSDSLRELRRRVRSYLHDWARENRSPRAMH